jgi:hypothetical protein
MLRHRTKLLGACLFGHVSESGRFESRRGTLPRSMRCARMRAHRFNQSSTIDRIVYDDRASTLCISFRDTGKYVYDGVPSSLFEAFCRAPSAGGFFNERIKDR